MDITHAALFHRGAKGVAFTHAALFHRGVKDVASPTAVGIKSEIKTE